MSAFSAGRSALVDWDLAQRIGLRAAGEGCPRRKLSPSEVTRAASGTVELVCGYTGLVPEDRLPTPEAVDRSQWIRSNIGAVRSLAGPVESRLGGSLAAPEPLAGLTQSVAATVAAAQLGLALGYLARRVLGQYDVARIGPVREPRLLLVAPNLAEIQERLGAERQLFLRWVALHEATHAVQFASVPWLRPRLGALLQELLDSASLRPELADLRRSLGRLLSPAGLAGLADHLREAGLIGLVAGPRQRRALAGLQAMMATVEGYAEHVMDAVGADLHPGYSRLRALLEAQRANRGALDTIAMRLLGLDVKLRQYALGRRFADTVAARHGIDGLNRVWRSPESLPRARELADPPRWEARVLAAPA